MAIAFNAHAAATIAVDVGHSSARPGATSATGIPEFQFNRRLASTIAKTIDGERFRVLLIGADGNESSLLSRTKKAEHADLFLSVHHDSVQPKYLSNWHVKGKRRQYSDRFAGYSLFVSRKNAFAARSLQCASWMGEQLRRAGFVPSEHHAEPIPGESRTFADRANGVYFYDDLIVLKTAASPAVLLEAGVIVNRQEERSLWSDNSRSKMANAMGRAVEQCVGQAQSIGFGDFTQPGRLRHYANTRSAAGTRNLISRVGWVAAVSQPNTWVPESLGCGGAVNLPSLVPGNNPVRDNATGAPRSERVPQLNRIEVSILAWCDFLPIRHLNIGFVQHGSQQGHAAQVLD